MVDDSVKNIPIDAPITDISAWLWDLGFSILHGNGREESVVRFIRCNHCHYERVAVAGWEADSFCLLVLINHRLINHTGIVEGGEE